MQLNPFLSSYDDLFLKNQFQSLEFHSFTKYEFLACGICPLVALELSLDRDSSLEFVQMHYFMVLCIICGLIFICEAMVVEQSGHKTLRDTNHKAWKDTIHTNMAHKSHVTKFVEFRSAKNQAVLKAELLIFGMSVRCFVRESSLTFDEKYPHLSPSITFFAQSNLTSQDLLLVYELL